MPSPPSSSILLRHDLRPGDLGRIVSFHGLVYARERGFDSTFEAYVAAPLAEFVLSGMQNGRLWIAERNDDLVGCIAIVDASTPTVRQAQLRWYLVAPNLRGQGLGRQLLSEALSFSRQRGFQSVFLWTESALTVASQLYQQFGFRRTESRPGRVWGVDLVEERYEVSLS